MGDEIGMIMVVLLTALPLYYSMQIATKLTFQQPGVQGEGPARTHPKGRRENSSIVDQYTKKYIQPQAAATRDSFIIQLPLKLIISLSPNDRFNKPMPTDYFLC